MSDFRFDDIAPLAEKMRPKTIDEVSGQSHLLGKDKFLRKIIENNQPTSLVLWGPPGTGKTTLARIMGEAWQADFIEISAVASGIADVRRVVEHAQQNVRLGMRTLLFVDEIHRFNKSQQDAFLPHVENGTIILVGATTENPSFEVNSALLSRARVVQLQPLDANDMKKIIKQAVEVIGAKIEPKAIEVLAEVSDGDARVAISAIETAAKLSSSKITIDSIKQALQRRSPNYDKKGEDHYNVISAFIKSMRGSDSKAAMYYLYRMLSAGEDPKFIARRIVIFASEDIGMASPHALTLAVSAFQAIERIGLPEGEYALSQSIIAMCEAKKSRSVADIMSDTKQLVEKYPNAQVPTHLRNAPTKLMKEIGYGEGYRWEAGFEHNKGFLPEEINDKL